METLKESSLINKDIHVDSLVPAKDNPNSMTKAQLERLCKEIRDLGCIDPIDVIPLSDGRYEILGGEHRWMASKMAGLTYVPCVIHAEEKWTDPKTVTLQRLKLNVLRGKVGGAAFFKLYKQVCDDVGPEKAQETMAIVDTEEWKRLTKSVIQSLKDQGAPPEVIDQARQAEKKSKTPADLSQRLSKIVKKYANSIMSNVVVFQYDKEENVLLKASPKTFELIKAIGQYAMEHGQDINELLEPILDNVVKNFGPI